MLTDAEKFANYFNLGPALGISPTITDWPGLHSIVLESSPDSYTFTLLIYPDKSFSLLTCLAGHNDILLTLRSLQHLNSLLGDLCL